MKNNSSLNDRLEKEVTSGRRIEVSRTTGKKSSAKSYWMDLRIHTPAALGYFGIEGLETAPALVRLARVKGLDIIAVTDFYSGKFIDQLRVAADNTKITVIPGTAIRCRLGICDEVTLVCLFPEKCNGTDVQKFLNDLGVPDEASGDEGHVLSQSFEEVIRVIENHQAIAVPSRMDKTPHRMAIIPRLVEEYGFKAFDLAYSDSTKWFKKQWPQGKFSLFSFSNASALAQIGSRKAKVKLACPGFEGIKELAARDALQKGG
jgi:hypothetical protein